MRINRTIRIYSACCIFAIVGGFLFCAVQPQNITWDELSSLTHDKKLAKSQIGRIEFVAADVPSALGYPHIRVYSKDLTRKRILKNPTRSQRARLLGLSAAYGIDFNDRLDVYPTFSEGLTLNQAIAFYHPSSWEFSLVKNGKPTANYISSPHPAFLNMRDVPE